MTIKLLTFLTAASAAPELTMDNFDVTIKGGKGTFVKFLAPW
jgi:hypothetical protein